MNEHNLQRFGITTLRISLGAILIVHSLWLKLVIFTLPGTAAFFESLGLPGMLAYATFAVEAITGIALVLGIESRWAALISLPVLAGATWAHSANGWLFTNSGGGWEYPLLLTVAALTQSLLGDGALALRRSSTLGIVRTSRHTPKPSLS
ncbi:MAG: hypothetical protein CL581_13100 [Alteromonadaceae bacterium]|nr:hypothetical protein [Alteromonadaceae bacterium]MBH86055.1 hypothetical protein [Alteromonadaceae bacterium]|tara:strand:- start:319 stop:768 length:450 start_codon:yes stop_codon:yes gene_type:complete